MIFDSLKTNISTAYWCAVSDGGFPRFDKARISLDGREPREVSWFDELFGGGFLLPHQTGSRPLTFLITGPPGAGKTTLAMEFCYRMAQVNGLFSLYISTEAETQWLINRTESLHGDSCKNVLCEFKRRPPDRPSVTIYGRDKAKSWETLSALVEMALAALSKWLVGLATTKKLSNQVTNLLWTEGRKKEFGLVSPPIVVIDSLNIVKQEERANYFEQIVSVIGKETKLIVLVLDSVRGGSAAHDYWEFVCDNVVRLDNGIVRLDPTTLRDYYVRTIEVVKARYQTHASGKHQLKIYGTFDSPRTDDPDRIPKMRRAHPYRSEGGIFVYPSIHYYLSLYKRRGATAKPTSVPTKIRTLNETLGRLGAEGDTGPGGLPEGRCTAFVGSRGGHKSHLGYLQILSRLVDTPSEGALVISLRDDEEMTRVALAKILLEEFGVLDPEGSLRQYEGMNRLEIVYYPPGYITPDEFFHRMLMSIHHLKTTCAKTTVLFNSIDQLSARFPLCAGQSLFIPGIIETLSGEKATSIFVAVDEPGQPVEQYGLLPMADLILTFASHRLSASDYYLCHRRAMDEDPEQYNMRAFPPSDGADQDATIESTIVQVARFAGGQRAGKQGLLELVDTRSLSKSVFARPGLHFTPLRTAGDSLSARTARA